MKRTLLLVLAAPLVASQLAGCLGAVAVGAGAAALSAADRRTTGTQVEDERIELVASNRFSERFGDKAHINATSYNRTVLLTGEVPDDKMKAEAEGIVRGLPNVRGLVNELQVAGVSSLSSRASDSSITGKVKARFLDSSKFSPLVVKVVTEASVVYLLGIVTEDEAAAATEIARTTGGVRKVVKVFDYCKPIRPARRRPRKKNPGKKNPRSSGNRACAQGDPACASRKKFSGPRRPRNGARSSPGRSSSRTGCSICSTGVTSLISRKPASSARRSSWRSTAMLPRAGWARAQTGP